MSYDTFNRASESNGRPPDSDRVAEEGSALLPKSQTTHFLKRIRQKLHEDISAAWADVVLVFAFLNTGIVDATATHFWGSFVSMQTGNTIYLGLGIANPSKSNRWLKALASILFFALGALFFGTFHRLGSSPHRRWIFVASFAIQAILIIAAAIIVTANKSIDPGLLTWGTIVPIAVLSFNASGQAVASRILEYNELPTVVLTSVYCDLMSDPKLFSAGLTYNSKRNRRIGAVVMTLLGAIVGGKLVESEVGVPGALWIAAGLKIIIAVSWMVWKAKPDK